MYFHNCDLFIPSHVTSQQKNAEIAILYAGYMEIIALCNLKQANHLRICRKQRWTNENAAKAANGTDKTSLPIDPGDH